MYSIHRIGQDEHWQQSGTPPTLIGAPQWPNNPCNAPMWLYRVGKKPSMKADLAIYSHVVDVSRQCMIASLILGCNWISFLEITPSCLDKCASTQQAGNQHMTGHEFSYNFVIRMYVELKMA